MLSKQQKEIKEMEQQLKDKKKAEQIKKKHKELKEKLEEDTPKGQIKRVIKDIFGDVFR